MTKEEKEFSDKIDRVELEELMYDEFYELIAEAKKIGYKKAMRWRDPKKELPGEGVDVFVKVVRSGEYGEETIHTSSHVVNDFYHDSESNPFGCEGYYPAGNGGIVRARVIGWRPIE